MIRTKQELNEYIECDRKRHRKPKLNFFGYIVWKLRLFIGVCSETDLLFVSVFSSVTMTELTVALVAFVSLTLDDEISQLAKRSETDANTTKNSFFIVFPFLKNMSPLILNKRTLFFVF